jgi:hypothetical protein
MSELRSDWTGREACPTNRFENGQRVFENGHPWGIKLPHSSLEAVNRLWKGNCTEPGFSSGKNESSP